MNAVKRCLALFAATLVVGACSGDPTAGEAGADLTIRATPGAVWLRNNSSAAVLIEAVDKLGGPGEGSWAVGTVTGPFTVAVDPDYRPSSTGSIATAARFVVTPTAEGDGSVVFTGTGGPITVPVRIAPDSNALALIFDSPVQVGTTVTVPPGALVTAHLPAGLRFTSGTTVRSYVGPLARDSAIYAPKDVVVGADSVSISYRPGPNSTGQTRITGIANTTTPGLATFARTAATVVTPQFDTINNTLYTFTPAPVAGKLNPAVGDSMQVAVPANWVIIPNRTVNYQRQTFSGTTLLADSVKNGLSAGVVYRVNADSSIGWFVAGPGSSGNPRFTVALRADPRFIFAARAKDTVLAAAADTNNLPVTISNTTPTVTDTVTIGIAAPYRLTRADTLISVTPTSGGANPIFVSFAADSTSAKYIFPPGASGKVRLPRVVFRNGSATGYAGRSAGTLASAPPPPLAATFSNAAPAANTPVTITMPAGFKLRPTSTFQDTTATPRTFIVVSRSADSNSAVVLPVPGYNGVVRISAVQLQAAPGFSLTLNTTLAINVGAAPDLGQDDRTVAGFGTFTATLANGETTGFYDQMTLGSPDRIPNGQGGGFPNQWIELVVTNAGTYTVSLDWLGTTTDLDLFVVNQAGTTRLLTAASLARPEAGSVVLAAGTYWIAMADFETGGQWIQVTIRRTS